MHYDEVELLIDRARARARIIGARGDVRTRQVAVAADPKAIREASFHE